MLITHATINWHLHRMHIKVSDMRTTGAAEMHLDHYVCTHSSFSASEVRQVAFSFL
jgi:hypothetical protein